jgi:RNA polymerase sigma-70 factor (ECF subfamily)
VSSAKLNDSQLLQVVRGAAAHDPRAVERLFTNLLPRVRNLVRYLVRGDRDVDDLSQDALVAVLRGLSSYRADGGFYAWADRVVARSVFAALKRRTQNSLSQLDKVQLDQLDSAEGTPDTDFMLRRQLAALLDQLPLEQRTTLVLRYVLGFSTKEIAREWDVPEETVRSRLRLAKSRLRRMLETDTEIAGDHSLAEREMVG